MTQWSPNLPKDGTHLQSLGTIQLPGSLPRDSDSVVGQGRAQGFVVSTKFHVFGMLRQLWNVFVRPWKATMLQTPSYFQGTLFAIIPPNSPLLCKRTVLSFVLWTCLWFAIACMPRIAILNYSQINTFFFARKITVYFFRSTMVYAQCFLSKIWKVLNSGIIDPSVSCFYSPHFWYQVCKFFPHTNQFSNSPDTNSVS